MKISKTLDNLNKTSFIDIMFLGLLFLAPILSFLCLQFNTNQLRLCFLSVISLWSLLRPFYSETGVTHLSLFDAVIFSVFIYVFINFCLYARVTINYYMVWVCFGYFLYYFILRWTFNTLSKSLFILHFVLSLIVFTSSIQGIIGFLQYFDLLTTKNEFFKLLGSFSSPNYYATYIGFGVIVLIWYFMIIKIQRLPFIILGILGITLFLILIILSFSRGAWLGIIGSIVTFILTSKKGQNSIKKFTLQKIVFGFLLIALLTFFGAKHLYNLKPDSVDGRLLVAQISLKEIAKRPLLGHGLFTFPGEYNKAKADYFKTGKRSWKEKKVATYAFSPFNDYLLIIFELGLPFLLIFITMIGWVFYNTKITNETRIGLALFVNVLIFALSNTPLHSFYLMLVGIFGFVILLEFGEIKRKSFETPIIFKRAVPILFFLFGSLGVYALSMKIINQNKSRNLIVSTNSLDVKNLMDLYKSTEDNLYSEYVLGKRLYENGRKDLGIKFMEKAFQNSYAPKIGKQLANCYVQEGNFSRAQEILKLNMNIEPYRYEPKMDLLDLFQKLNRYNEVVELSKEIKNSQIKIPSKEIDEFKERASVKALKNLSLIDENLRLKGSLSVSKSLKSTILNKTLSYRVYLPPTEKIKNKLPIIYVNDGENYIKKGGMVNTLDSLIVNNVIQPVSAIFLEPRDSNDNNIRQELFLCNHLFVKFFWREFVPQIERLYPVSSEYKDRTIWGVSFGGLASAYLADKLPKTFKNIVMQSPAFHPCPGVYRSYSAKVRRDFKMYLSYGTGDDTANQDLPFIKILKSKGYDLKVNCVEGANHEWSLWKGEIDEILMYFFKQKANEF